MKEGWGGGGAKVDKGEREAGDLCDTYGNIMNGGQGRKGTKDMSG